MKTAARNIPARLFILFPTLLGMAACVAPLIWRKYEIGGGQGRELLLALGFDALCAFVQFYCLFFGLTLHRVLFAIAVPLLFVVSAATTYLMLHFNTVVNEDVIIAALGSVQTREVKEFISVPLLACMAAALVAAMLIVYAYFRYVRLRPQDRPVSLLGFAMTWVLVLINNGEMSVAYPPYNVLVSSAQYAKYAWMPAPVRRDTAKEAAASFKSPAEPLITVLVIGESARADHLALNGYTRPTSPWLEKRENVVSFPDVTSCGVFTRVAVPCMLTRATHKNPRDARNETSIISVFRSLGFRTAWLGVQGPFMLHEPMFFIMHEAETHKVLAGNSLLSNITLDGELLPLLDRQLEAHAGDNQFIVLHLGGSHWQYGARFPEEFAYFTPYCAKNFISHGDVDIQAGEMRACVTGGEPQALINGYDNSIRYTDYILDQIMARLEGKNALLLYISDHAESLGEGGRYLHGNEEAPEQWKVPMVWWASESFIHARPDAWRQLEAKRLQPASQDNVFHSLLDCSGIESRIVQDGLSLCR